MLLIKYNGFNLMFMKILIINQIVTKKISTLLALKTFF